MGIRFLPAWYQGGISASLPRWNPCTCYTGSTSIYHIDLPPKNDDGVLTSPFAERFCKLLEVFSRRTWFLGNSGMQRLQAKVQMTFAMKTGCRIWMYLANIFFITCPCPTFSSWDWKCHHKAIKHWGLYFTKLGGNSWNAMPNSLSLPFSSSANLSGISLAINQAVSVSDACGNAMPNSHTRRSQSIPNHWQLYATLLICGFAIKSNQEVLIS